LSNTEEIGRNLNPEKSLIAEMRSKKLVGDEGRIYTKKKTKTQQKEKETEISRRGSSRAGSSSNTF